MASLLLEQLDRYDIIHSILFNKVIGDQMDWNFFLSLYLSISFAIGICTSLFIGLSLVEVKLSKIAIVTLYISIIYSVVFYLLQFVIDSNLLLIAIYASLTPTIIYFLRIPVLQATIAILLALIYDLLIKLVVNNLFDLALLSSGISDDPVIQLALTTFVMMCNIFISLFIFQKSPVLFPKRWFNLEGTQANLYKIHFIFVVLILISVNTLLYYTYTELLFFRVNYRIFVIFWSIITCSLLVFFTRKIVIYNIEKTQFSIDQAYQKDLLSFYNIIRSQRHDFNIHLTSIYGLIRNQKYAESSNYIEEVVGEAKYINDLLPLHHPATGSMLYTLKILSLQKGITITFHLKDDLKEMPCTIYETNKILGNLINNAIEEVEQHISEVPPLIDVELTKENEYIILRVTNNTTMEDQQVEHMFNAGFSTKPSHEGIGLPNIAEIIANYNGVLYPELGDGKITMNVRIPIFQ